MDEYAAMAGKMKIETFEKMFTVEGLDCSGSDSGVATLSSRGDLSFHRWTPEQLQCLSECVLFLTRRLKGYHLGDCESHSNKPCDCGVGSHTPTALTGEEDGKG